MRVQRPPADLHLSVGIVVLLLTASPAAAGAGITGRVLGPDGKPVAGAVVDALARESAEAQADRHAAGQARAAMATARTGADGTFRIDSSRPLAGVEARADGFVPVYAGLSGDAPLTVTLRRVSRKRGVIRSKGRPVERAVVVWMSDGAETMVRTAADGAYEVPDPASSPATLRVIHPDYAPQQDWVMGAGANLDQDLGAGIRVAGTVVDAAGSPVPGAALYVDGSTKGATTNAKGQFAIEHAQPDWSFLTARTDTLMGAVARKSGAVVLTVKPGRSVTGVVRDEKTGQPVAGSTVMATATIGYNASADTDARGQYTLSGLPAGRYRLYAGGDGFVSGPADYARAAPMDLRDVPSGRRDFALAPLPRVTGRVEDEERRPVEGAAVSLNFRDTPPLYGAVLFEGMQLPGTRTAADGSFTLHMPSADVDANPMLKDGSVMALKTGYAAAQVEAKGAAGRPLTIHLTRGVELKGRVIGPDGAALPGVAVSAAEDGTFAGTMMPMYMVLASVKGEGWTTTDAAGQFSMRVRPASHHLSFRKPGHAPKVVRGHDPRSGASLDVALEPAATLRGVLARADGIGIAGAAVTATQDMSMVTASATTGTDGTFEVGDLGAGLYVLTVSHPDLGIQMTRTVEAPAADVRFVLGPAGTIRGRVADAVTGQPVTRFKIGLPPDEASGRQHREVASEDAGGAFSIADVPVGDVVVVATAEGYAAKRMDATVTVDGEAPALEIALEAEVPITGRVTSDGKAPVPETHVSVEATDEARPGGTITDDDGLYELAGVAAGPVTLKFEAQGFLPERRALDTRESPRADVTLRKGLSLRGDVVSDGIGVAEATVMAQSSAQGATYQTTQTDDRGRFTLEGLVPGRYTVSAFADKGKAKQEDVDVEKTAPIRLVLKRGPTAVLTGTVMGLPPGEEAGVVMVMVSGDEGTAHGLVDAAHAFRIEDAPAGRVQARAMASYVSGTTRTSRGVDLTLAAGSETDTVIRFTGDAVISGVVVRDGAPVPGVSVTFAAPDHTETGGRTDGRGAYQVSGLEAGLHRVTVAGDNAAFNTTYLVTESGQFDIDITGGSVTGRAVRADDGTPLANVAIALFRMGENENTPAASASTNAQGVFSARSLREGPYRLITAKPGFGQAVRQVEVPVGGTAEVLLELSEADGISVTVLDARDNRALDAIVVVRDAARQIVANQHSGLGADGVLNIPLAPGSYLLSTSASGYGTVTRPVTAPAQGLRIGLTPGGTLVIESPRDLRGRVRLIQPDGEEYVRCWCNGIAEIQLVGRRTSIENITPGNYTVELVDAPDGVAPKPVLIREGQTSTLTFE